MRNLSLIFICVHNSARSQMAEAFLKAMGNDLFTHIESAGLEAGKLNPLVVKAMSEIGIDISKNRTKRAMDFLSRGSKFDYVVTVCDKANAEKCPIFPGSNIRIQWSFPDPSELQGTDEEKLAEIRLIRDEIRQAVQEFSQGIRSNGYPLAESRV